MKFAVMCPSAHKVFLRTHKHILCAQSMRTRDRLSSAVPTVVTVQIKHSVLLGWPRANSLSECSKISSMDVEENILSAKRFGACLTSDNAKSANHLHDYRCQKMTKEYSFRVKGLQRNLM